MGRIVAHLVVIALIQSNVITSMEHVCMGVTVVTRDQHVLKNAKMAVLDKTVKTCAIQRVDAATKQPVFVTLDVIPDGLEYFVKKRVHKECTDKIVAYHVETV